MPLSIAEVSAKSRGGTELMRDRLAELVPADLIDRVQVVFSRVRELDADLPRVFYAHDLPGDPESDFLKHEGWRAFNRIVFVSNWQMQAYINHYKIPWSRCRVIRNAIPEFDYRPVDRWRDGKPVRLIHHSTPHRGLEVLVPVFERICDEWDDSCMPKPELRVFSSFDLYGWSERDRQYESLFERCRNHPQIYYSGAVPNREIREWLLASDVFVHPGIWPETSCLCLMEAMGAGLACVHSNFAALAETGAGLTFEYQYQEDREAHEKVLYEKLRGLIQAGVCGDPLVRSILPGEAARYASRIYGLGDYRSKWIELLEEVVQEGPPKTVNARDRGTFTYRVV